MGLTQRKKSGNIIGGSRLIVPGQDVYNVKKFDPSFDKNETSPKEPSNQNNSNKNSGK